MTGVQTCALPILLDKADAIRRKRQQSIQLLDDLLKSTFLDMFGDPVTNPKGWPVKSLGDVCTDCLSGGTPSKKRDDFWGGRFPWVSPKDMKRLYIDDSQDHVTKVAFQETSLKKIPPNSILIVVRGMILAHTVPIAINSIPISINQDMKALRTDTMRIMPLYLLSLLRAQHGNLLSQVSTAAHGTKRLELQKLMSVPITLPDIQAQMDFCNCVQTMESVQNTITKTSQESLGLLTSTSQRAFRGEL